MSRCHNAVPRDQVKRRFESLASREYVGQQQAWNNVRVALESYTGLSPRATCGDWVLHFTGPSGSGKSFLAEIIANSAFYPWELEAYSFAQLGIASAACLAVGALSWALGPVGMGVGCTAGAVGANAVWNNAQISSTFQVPQPFPSQCGVLQYKFSRSSGVDDVRLWEYRVAQELLRDPAAVIIVDDVGRLRDVTAFEHFGRLLCGVGGNSIPEFRKGPGDSVLVPASQALFVLTSDLELEQADNHISCEVGSFHHMLQFVREQSERFWESRHLFVPDWWDRLPLVPFRELCLEELSQAIQKYLNRQCELAAEFIEADLVRRSSWAVGAQRVLSWTGTVKFGQSSQNTIDAYITGRVAQNKLVGGRQGAWVISELHMLVMRPAMQTLTVGHHGEGNLVMGEGRYETVTWLNYTTITYTRDLCLEVVHELDDGLPQIRFTIMQDVCR